MKKEKTIRTYQRRTKTGKIVTVKQHTAKYDAADVLKEAAKKKGAGDEIEQRRLDAEWKKIEDDFMKKHPDFEAFDDEGNETKENAAIIKKKEAFTKKHPSWKGGVKSGPKEKSAKRSIIEKAPKSDSSYGFTSDEYKAWYHWDQDADPKNKSALKVEKALKKQMGTKAYNKYFDELTDNYSARGHNKAFKGLSETFGSKDVDKMVEGQKTQLKKAGVDPDKRLSGKKATEAKKDLVSKGFVQKKDEYGDTYLMKGKEVYHYIPGGIVMGGAKLDRITGGKDYNKAKKLFDEKSVTSTKETKDIKAAQESVENLTKMVKDKRFSRLSKKDQQHYKAKLAAEKALLKNLQSGKASSDVDEKAQKTYDKTYKTSKETKGSKREGSELSGEKVGSGIAFKNNKAGQAWAKKNGEPVVPFGKEGGTYYKVGNDLYGNITGGHGGTIWGKVGASTAKRLLKYAEDDSKRKGALKNPTIPTSSSARTSLYKMLTSKDTKLWDVPDKYRGFFTNYGNPSSKGKAFIKEFESSKTSTKSKSSDVSSKIKEAHEALKEKGYKRYTYRGEVYYATKLGTLKQVDSDGRVRNVAPFGGARGTQESALKGWKRRDAEKAKAKRDREDAKKYRESLKSKSPKDVSKVSKSSSKSKVADTVGSEWSGRQASAKKKALEEAGFKLEKNPWKSTHSFRLKKGKEVYLYEPSGTYKGGAQLHKIR